MGHDFDESWRVYGQMDERRNGGSTWDEKNKKEKKKKSFHRESPLKRKKGEHREVVYGEMESESTFEKILDQSTK